MIHMKLISQFANEFQDLMFVITYCDWSQKYSVDNEINSRTLFDWVLQVLWKMGKMIFSSYEKRSSYYY